MAKARVTLYVNGKYAGCDGEFWFFDPDHPGMCLHISDPRGRGGAFGGPYDKELIFPKALSSCMNFEDTPKVGAQLRWARSKNPIDNFEGTIEIRGDHFKVRFDFGPEKKGKKNGDCKD